MLYFIETKYGLLSFIGKTGTPDSAGSTVEGCKSNSNNDHIRMKEMAKTTNYTVASYNNGNIDIEAVSVDWYLKEATNLN